MLQTTCNGNPPHIYEESYERYQGGFVTTFLPVVLGRGGFWHRVYVISKRCSTV